MRRHFIVDVFVDFSCLQVGCHVKNNTQVIYQQCSFLVMTQSKCSLMKFIVSLQTGNVLKSTSVGLGDKFTL